MIMFTPVYAYKTTDTKYGPRGDYGLQVSCGRRGQNERALKLLERTTFSTNTNDGCHYGV